MKKILAIIFVLATLVACTAQQQTTPTPSGNVAAPEAQLSNGHTVEINMTAENFQFSPSTITVHQGDHVIIHIVNSDEDHGIAIQGYDQHVEFGDGQQDTVLDFVADKTGTFTFYCNVPCGRGHRNMKGTLTVEA